MIRAKRLRPLAVLSDKPLELEGYRHHPAGHRVGRRASSRTRIISASSYPQGRAGAGARDRRHGVEERGREFGRAARNTPRATARNSRRSTATTALKAAMPAIQSHAWQLHDGRQVEGRRPTRVGIAKPVERRGRRAAVRPLRRSRHRSRVACGVRSGAHRRLADVIASSTSSATDLAVADGLVLAACIGAGARADGAQLLMPRRPACRDCLELALAIMDPVDPAIAARRRDLRKRNGRCFRPRSSIGGLIAALGLCLAFALGLLGAACRSGWRRRSSSPRSCSCSSSRTAGATAPSCAAPPSRWCSG